MEILEAYAEIERREDRRRQELNEKYGSYRPVKKTVYAVDSMLINVDYTAMVGSVEHLKRGEEHIFIQTRVRPDPETGNAVLGWEDVDEDAYAIRDKFLSAKTPEQAKEFLRETGIFSPLRQRLTWREFQKWQQFARLVQGHDDLAAAMQANSWSGDCGEVLKALTGKYASMFFDGCEAGLYAEVEPSRDPSTDPEATRRLMELAAAVRATENHAEFLRAFERENLEIQTQDRAAKWEREKEDKRRALWQWFIKPPVKIEWRANGKDTEGEILKLHQDDATGLVFTIPEESPLLRAGAMIEFLLPREQLTPELVIRPMFALEAIAAAIYAERIQGIAYRKCDWCGELFKMGRHKTKRYCDSTRCKGNARKQRQRTNRRQDKEQASSKRLKVNGRKATRA